ncbi:MAG: hypothetical protein HC831_14290 [Chloroflexia bacterium]|nr:hypothetical protein [Chloroflexia bacterium]
MKNIIYIAAFLFALTANVGAQTTIVNGKFSAEKHRRILKTFPVSKGDFVQFNVTSLHKKKESIFW